MTMTPQRRSDPRKVALHARNVHFDWTDLPFEWIPGEHFASHYINVLNLLLPEGERWFVQVFSEILPMIQDDQLHEDVVGFIGQEGVHAASHQGVQDYYTANGLDVRPYVAEIEAMFRKVLGDRDLEGEAREEWLIERAAMVAGIEHLTAVLGNWSLNSPKLDELESNETMLDLLRWHGAEEVEHRTVAYDVYKHIDGRYWRRVRTYAVGGVLLFSLWWRGVKFMMANDPTIAADATRPRARIVKLIWAEARHVVPGLGTFAKASWKYLLPTYHPSQEGSTSQAVAYLAKSPAAMRADALTINQEP
ncbi:metal-dependent hydrolase [Gordonia sp. zg691]|uniref:metal-dependent hydrolase n=1 Tax=Gordonia jinghuaiqii TaxID=2758710 RepID=UPI0016624CD7|nr:metal-dependent hydrolase [Gordonia jinghuaiqii]MBD0862163.1 metal-dependent hydrolase [Gordonia jinghuaiqii]